MRGFFVGAGFNSVGHRVGGRRRPGAGRVGRRGRADQRPGRRSTSAGSRRSTATTGWLRDAGRGGARAALRRAVAEPRARDRPAVPLLAAARPARGARRVLRLEDGLGAAQRLRPGRASTGARRTPGASRAWLRLVGGGAARHPDGGRGLRPDVVLEVRRRRAGTPRPALQWVCTNDVACRSGTVVYTALLNRRGTYESDLTVTRVGGDGVPAGQQLGDHRARPRLAPAARPGGPRHPGRRRDLGVRRARGDGAALARPARRGSRRRTCPTRLPASRPAAELRLGDATVRATRITYVGELGWELYVPVELAAGVYDDLMARRRGPRRGRRGLLRDRVAAAGEGLPRVRPRADARLRAGRGRAAVRAASCGADVDFLGREALVEHGPRPTGARGAGWCRSSSTTREPMLWGGELRAARRRARSARSPAPRGARPSAPASGSATSAPTAR